MRYFRGLMNNHIFVMIITSSMVLLTAHITLLLYPLVLETTHIVLVAHHFVLKVLDVLDGGHNDLKVGGRSHVGQGAPQRGQLLPLVDEPGAAQAVLPDQLLGHALARAQAVQPGQTGALVDRGADYSSGGANHPSRRSNANHNDAYKHSLDTVTQNKLARTVICPGEEIVCDCLLKTDGDHFFKQYSYPIGSKGPCDLMQARGWLRVQPAATGTQNYRKLTNTSIFRDRETDG